MKNIKCITYVKYEKGGIMSVNETKGISIYHDVIEAAKEYDVACKERSIALLAIPLITTIAGEGAEDLKAMPEQRRYLIAEKWYKNETEFTLIYRGGSLQGIIDALKRYNANSEIKISQDTIGKPRLWLPLSG
jgi:hypothetical protein